jgi:hypothetical protein
VILSLHSTNETRLVNNPNAIQAMRQQQILQQQRQAMFAQQAFQNNMGVGMPMGMPLNPQQIHQLRQAGRLGPVRL